MLLTTNARFLQFQQLMECTRVRAILVTSPAAAMAKYCDEYVCVSVCPRAYLRDHTYDLYHFFRACCLWP